MTAPLPNDDPRTETDFESDAVSGGSIEEDLIDDEPIPERETIVALRSWCTAPKGSSCRRCVIACPHDALSLSDSGPVIDEERCTNCGLCAGVCDTFAWSRITLEDLFARCKREAEQEGPICFTCNEHIFPGVAPRSNVIVLPCLASVPPEFWSALLANGLEVSLFLDRSYCNECQAAGAIAPLLFDHALSQAQEWTGRSIAHVQSIPERESILSLYANIDQESRRELLARFANEGMDIATGKHRQRNTGAIDSFHESQERLRAKGRIRAAEETATLPAVFQKKTTWPRQKLIVDAARKMPERAALLQRYASTTDKNICQRSHDCVNVCPTGARTIDDEGYPSVDLTRCIACGTCSASCQHQACEFIAITAQAYCD